MQTQSVFIVHPTTIDQINALKAFVKALKIKFEVTASEKPYNPEFVAKIKESREQYKNGNYTVIKTDNLWK
jgi:predicted small secreted protein